MRAVLLLLLIPSIASAGVYSTAEPCPFAIKPDGTAEELSFKPDKSGRFKQELTKYELILNPEKKSPERDAVLARLAKDQAPADRAADLIRLGRLDDALNLLEPRTRDRVPDFRVLANLAHAYAVRGDYSDAIRKHSAAWLDAEYPTELPGTTAAQVKWLKRVEKDYYPRWLKLHRDRGERKTPPDAEEVLPLFEGKPPSDAIAITQQLLLWAPADTSLLWLLAELYTADGRVREAEVLFDDCAWSRSYSNRKLLMAHRETVRRAVAALPPPVEESFVLPTTPPPPKKEATLEDIGLSETSLIAFGAVFGSLAVLLIALQIRSIRRRRRM
jgi:tetratricopeptide (TPR) repeat protein